MSQRVLKLFWGQTNALGHSNGWWMMEFGLFLLCKAVNDVLSCGQCLLSLLNCSEWHKRKQIIVTQSAKKFWEPTDDTKTLIKLCQSVSSGHLHCSPVACEFCSSSCEGCQCAVCAFAWHICCAHLQMGCMNDCDFPEMAQNGNDTDSILIGKIHVLWCHTFWLDFEGFGRFAFQAIVEWNSVLGGKWSEWAKKQFCRGMGNGTNIAWVPSCGSAFQVWPSVNNWSTMVCFLTADSDNIDKGDDDNDKDANDIQC